MVHTRLIVPRFHAVRAAQLLRSSSGHAAHPQNSVDGARGRRNLGAHNSAPAKRNKRLAQQGGERHVDHLGRHMEWGRASAPAAMRVSQQGASSNVQARRHARTSILGPDTSSKYASSGATRCVFRFCGGTRGRRGEPPLHRKQTQTRAHHNDRALRRRCEVHIQHRRAIGQQHAHAVALGETARMHRARKAHRTHVQLPVRERWRGGRG